MSTQPLQTQTGVNWFWIARDGRIYSSLRNALIDAIDTGYLQFIAFYNAASPWPNDASGNQTLASMLANLPLGTPLIVDLRMMHS